MDGTFDQKSSVDLEDTVAPRHILCADDQGFLVVFDIDTYTN